MTGSNLVAEPMSIIDLRQFAERIAGIYGDVVTAAAFPITVFIEAVLPKIDGYEDFVLEVLTDQEMPSPCMEAFTYPDRPRIAVRASVYEAACRDDGRGRFTLAHEVGHLFLHSGSPLVYARSRVPVPCFRDPEWQANQFASELLMPVARVRSVLARRTPLMAPQALAARCNVSLQAARWRISKLTAEGVLA